jgi:flagellar M-ring protein FliF
VERNASDTSGNNNAVSVANALPGAATPGGSESSRNTSGSTEETTNYEISKKVVTSTVDGGEVKKLSVAVVVDGTTAGEGAGTYKPRSAAEMAQITALVKSAMGFDQARGDQVQVTNMQFARMDVGAGTEAPKPLLGLDSTYWFKIIEAAVLGLTALLVGLFVVKPLSNRMFSAQVAVASGATPLPNASPVAGALAPPPGTMAMTADGQQVQIADAGPTGNPLIDINRIDGQVRESSIKKVGEVVNAHPEEALAIIRTWLHQPV